TVDKSAKCQKQTFVVVDQGGGKRRAISCGRQLHSWAMICPDPEVGWALPIRLEFGSNVGRSKGYPMKPSLRIPSLLVCLTSLIPLSAPTPSLAADKVIKIGGLLPISGPGSYFGVQDKQGVELALDELNKAGVGGYKFDVHYEDSACSPLPATQAAKRLLDQYQPDVVIGEECSDATLAVMPVMDQAKVPLL